MTERIIKDEGQDPGAILDLIDEKEAALARLRQEGRPVWGDPEVHRTQQDIKDLNARLTALGVEPVDDLPSQRPQSQEVKDILEDLERVANQSDAANQESKEE